MREAHAHIAHFGRALTLPRLDECASLAECLQRVVAQAGSSPHRPDGPWLRMTGARVEGWPERRWPTLAELDRACPVHPCVLMSFDHHAAVANSQALRAAGLAPGQRVGANGQVALDPRTGGPSGLLLEDAVSAAWNAAPDPSDEERVAMVLAALDRLHQLGFTEVDDLHTPPWLAPVLGDLDREGRLPVRVRLYPNIAALREVAAGRSAWETDRVALAGGKVFADGTLNNRTALMLSEYREPIDAASARGRAMVSPEQLRDAIGLTESLGLHLATHAIGDGAVRMVLDAIQQSQRTRSVSDGPSAARHPIHRIEHCELIDQADVPRFAALNVVCSVQPCHLLTDIEVLTRSLPHRLDRVLPLRELIDTGCEPAGPDRAGLLWFGSDVPIVRPEPADSIQAAVNRRRPGMSQKNALAWEQRISEPEAWRCFGKAPA